jgi:hypothetical protein
MVKRIDIVAPQRVAETRATTDSKDLTTGRSVRHASSEVS